MAAPIRRTGRGGRGLEAHRFTAFGGASCDLLAVAATDEEISQAVAEVYAFEARLTRFDRASELSRLNAAAGARVPVSPLLRALLQAALDAESLSEGLVNAAVLPALLRAGYDVSIEQVRARDAGPGGRLRAAASAPPAGDGDTVPPRLGDVLELGAGWAELRPGCAVDLGGVGKGWLADRLAERLENAVVNLGGDLRALGGGPDGTGWPIGLCDGTVVVTSGAGVATSGTSGRRWTGGHHLVDPRTGRPAVTDVTAVSVVAADALTAEVLAKAAAILGSVAGPSWALAHGAARAVALSDGRDPGEEGRPR